jgi:ATP-dependent DNA helicase RecG
MAKADSDLDLSRFATLGIRQTADLVLHLPMRYLDLTQVTPIAAIASGVDVQVQGTVIEQKILFKPRRQLVVILQDDSGELNCRFFHFYPSQQKMMAVGNQLCAYGTAKVSLLGAEMVHPMMRKPSDAALPQRLTPVYPSAAGLTQVHLRKAISQARALTEWPDTVPDSWLKQLNLMPIGAAIARLHEPPADADVAAFELRSDPAWQRIIFDELLAQQISLKKSRQIRRDQPANALADTRLCDRLIGVLPFALTGAQQRSWQGISAELALPVPMNRLLQGDVGSGKTVVAALAACQAISNGWQAALMAPTEILAEQHFRKLRGWLEPLGVRCAWLSGSLKESEKRQIRARCSQGEVDFLVGTHALIEDSVTFTKLGLAIVDEQHRFGVQQRLRLRTKLTDGKLAHQLMMSATPIPRTLAMSFFADLDVSVIDELPPGRTPIVTKLISEERRDQVVAAVADAVAIGAQVYWVCPLIDESEALQLQTAQETYAALQTQLPALAIGLVHGRLPSPEKAQVMAQFVTGELDVLVATTVIEVGVDVPRASLMVIEHAERFGLAQLHQLRGRVGRGAAKSTCVLLYRTPLSGTAKERLKIIYELTDGFEIARRDLMLRGPGEFLGARQSGQPLLRFADLERDVLLLEAASATADKMLAQRPELTQAHLARWFSSREEFLKA